MNKLVLISKGVRPLRNGNPSAKQYPFWNELESLLKKEGYEVKEIVEMPLDELEKFIKESLVVIAPDSFIQHFCWSIGKKAIVLWGTGHPNVYGHKENINILKDSKYLRPDPFLWWEDEKSNPEAFVSPQTILRALKENF